MTILVLLLALILVGIVMLAINALISAPLAALHDWLHPASDPLDAHGLNASPTKAAKPADAWRPGQLAASKDPRFAARIAEIDREITARQR